jgi:hypothetical protein
MPSCKIYNIYTAVTAIVLCNGVGDKTRSSQLPKLEYLIVLGTSSFPAAARPRRTQNCITSLDMMMRTLQRTQLLRMKILNGAWECN